MKLKLKYKLHNIINNSFWGIVSNIVQNIFLSLFFLILVRNYTKIEFGYYVIANSLYSIVLSFSNLGLGNWFIRELINQSNRIELIDKFFKIQFIIGIVFYILCIILSQILYWNFTITILTIIIGSNIILDNLIYVMKSINIADLNQNKTNIITTVETFVKLMVGVVVIYKNISIEMLLVILVMIRLVSLYVFIRNGSIEKHFYKKIINEKFNFNELKLIIMSNWTFVVISTIAILNWRIGNLFISKFLSLADVGYYEISFKLLSIAYIIPIVVSTTVYPHLLQSLTVSRDKMIALYNKVHFVYFIYGFFTFTFMYTYSENIIQLLFGNAFKEMYIYSRQMFFIMIFFPTVLLQANVMIAIKKERIDMYCNIVALLTNGLICIIGLQYFRNVSTVNFAIVTSFAIFHIIQDIILIKEKIVHLVNVIKLYVSILLATTLYIVMNNTINNNLYFWIFWILMGIVATIMYKSKIKQLLIKNISC